MRCPSCGREVPETKFCENCGAALPMVEPQPVAQPAEQPYGAYGYEAYLQQAEQPAAQVYEQPYQQPVVEQPYQQPYQEPVVAQPVEQPAAQPYDLAGADLGAGAAVAATSLDAQQVQPSQPEQRPYDLGPQFEPPQQTQPAPQEQQPQPAAAEAASAPAPEDVSKSENASEPAKKDPADYGFPFASAPEVPTATNTAFVLAIIGFILALTGIGFLPGLILCIIALVKNSKNTKAGLKNPHKTSTKVLSIIGIVLSTVAIALSIIFASLFVQVWNILAQYDFDVSRVEITYDQDKGEIVVIEKPTASTDTSTGTSSGATASSGAASSGSAVAPAAGSPTTGASDPRNLDVNYNPTVFAYSELSGAELKSCIETAGFAWSDASLAWFAPDGSMVYVSSPDGDLPLNDVSALSKGGAGSPVVFVETAEGYSTPTAAVTGLCKDMTIEDQTGDSNVVFVLMKGQSGKRFLMMCSQTDTNEQTLLVFNDESVQAGLLNKMIGVNMGTTIDQAWTYCKNAGVSAA